jgi:hypothetical protein
MNLQIRFYLSNQFILTHAFILTCKRKSRCRASKGLLEGGSLVVVANCSPGPLSLSSCYWYETILCFSCFRVFFLAYRVEGAVSEEMPMFMEFPTMERYVLIINGL